MELCFLEIFFEILIGEGNEERMLGLNLVFDLVEGDKGSVFCMENYIIGEGC